MSSLMAFLDSDLLMNLLSPEILLAALAYDAALIGGVVLLFRRRRERRRSRMAHVEG